MSNRKNHFEQKRIEAFTELNTSPSDWEHAKVVNFVYSSRHNKKGLLLEKWVPIYAIDEGYENAFPNDVNQKEYTKRCQLCDTRIENCGIIINKQLKKYLIVGLECYEVYETDSDREIKLKFLEKLKEDRINQMMEEECEKLKKLVIESEKFMRIPYRLYSFISRNRAYFSSKTKLNNMLVKWAISLYKMGYRPRIEMGMNPYIKFYREVANSKIEHSCAKYALDQISKINEKNSNSDHAAYLNNVVSSPQYNRNFIRWFMGCLNKNGISFETNYRNLREKIKTMNVDLLQKLCESEIPFSGWNVNVSISESDDVYTRQFKKYFPDEMVNS